MSWPDRDQIIAVSIEYTLYTLGFATIESNNWWKYFNKFTLATWHTASQHLILRKAVPEQAQVTEDSPLSAQIRPNAIRHHI